MSFGYPSPSEATIRKAAMLVAPIKHASYGNGAEKDAQEDGTCASTPHLHPRQGALWFGAHIAMQYGR